MGYVENMWIEKNNCTTYLQLKKKFVMFGGPESKASRAANGPRAVVWSHLSYRV